MTRINCGIPPAELTNKHLLAEHREIKRIPNNMRKGKFSFIGQPLLFKLGTGHVKFFYDKLGYLKKRYGELYAECKKRGFDVEDYSEAFENMPSYIQENYFKDYNPTEADITIVKQRISERLRK